MPPSQVQTVSRFVPFGYGNRSNDNAEMRRLKQQAPYCHLSVPYTEGMNRVEQTRSRLTNWLSEHVRTVVNPPARERAMHSITSSRLSRQRTSSLPT